MPNDRASSSVLFDVHVQRTSCANGATPSSFTNSAAVLPVPRPSDMPGFTASSATRAAAIFIS